MNRNLIEQLRLSAQDLDRPPSVQSQANIRAINAMHKAADLLESVEPGVTVIRKVDTGYVARIVGIPTVADIRGEGSTTVAALKCLNVGLWQRRYDHFHGHRRNPWMAVGLLMLAFAVIAAVTMAMLS